jgi:S-disulfanyl-L-cysteine oxidoreductase SoxD
MSRWVKARFERRLAIAAATLVLASGNALALNQTAAFPGIGRDATPREVAAWDIDVRPDFKGLPPGSGSVAKGLEVWEAKCASCHGVFGESNQVFNPVVGGTTKDDITTGRVAALKRTDYPGRTTLMKVPTVSTLWDYINRAMPWSQPKSLSVEEVYAVTAYLLNLADVVPADFTLSDKNIREVQQRMPNRNGMSSDHAFWPGPGAAKTKPDVVATACMTDCPVDAKVTSMLPPFARNAHGNLAEQNRKVGPQRGVDTQTTVPSKAAEGPPAQVAAASGASAAAAQALANQNNCVACHAIDRRIVGPSWVEIAGKHAGKPQYIASKIRSGGSGVWGTIPMPPQTIADADARQIANWLAAGAKN